MINRYLVLLHKVSRLFLALMTWGQAEWRWSKMIVRLQRLNAHWPRAEVRSQPVPELCPTLVFSPQQPVQEARFNHMFTEPPESDKLQKSPQRKRMRMSRLALTIRFATLSTPLMTLFVAESLDTWGEGSWDWHDERWENGLLLFIWLALVSHEEARARFLFHAHALG